MSALNTFTFRFPFGIAAACHAGSESVCDHAEEAVDQTRIPAISPRWSVEIASDGTRRLVQHWFKNEDSSTVSGDRRRSA